MHGLVTWQPRDLATARPRDPDARDPDTRIFPLRFTFHNAGRKPMYDEQIAGPMRAELTQLGFEETRTPQEVDAALQEKKGTVLVVVNSVCGCAAGVARPAIALALGSDVKPGRVITLFAGNAPE